jgi:hypothetical protein
VRLHSTLALLPIVVLLIVSAGLQTASAKDTGPWRADFEAARAEAIKAGKPFLLYVFDSV